MEYTAVKTLCVVGALMLLGWWIWGTFDSNMRQFHAQGVQIQRDAVKTVKKAQASQTHGCVGVSRTPNSTIYRCKDGYDGYVLLVESPYRRVALAR